MEDSAVADMLNLLDAGLTYPPPPAVSLSKLKPKADVHPAADDVDVSRIELVRTRNALQPRRLGSAFASGGPDDRVASETAQQSSMPAALYPPAISLIRHSCKPNWCAPPDSLPAALAATQPGG